MQSWQSMKHIIMSTSSSNEKENDWHQPGGTLILALEKWTSQILTMALINHSDAGHI